MELASTATSVRKRLRRSVQKRPKDTERERNSAGQVEIVEQKLTGEAICRNIELIWGHLTKNHACILGIYGMGGVGKTTIMMHIHDRLLRDATFDVVFITASKDFSIHKLQSDIGKALEIRDMEDEDQMKRSATLSQRLKRKKNCVLILDDVWEHLDLKEVGIPVEADGFKLVLTTRSLAVCLQMQCQEMIKIEPLSQEEAERLFLEELGSKVPLNLEIVKPIVKECAGLPIGVITMARSMRGATRVSELKDALERLKASSMGLKDMQKKVLMNLKFSYDRLGDPDVQQCFLSCALYPEDEWINKSELVEFFIDQGLIDELNTREERYNRGLTILNKLRNVCLLEDHGSKMKMHVLIRDMALHFMGATSMVKAGKQLMRIPSEECWTDTLEKVSLMRNQFREFPLNMSPNCPKLSTLLLDQCLSWNVAIPDSFFKNLLGLKVLNLSGNIMTELPNSISDLVNLRALLLRGCRKLRCIPYLGKLTSLRRLDANGCSNLVKLEGLEKLVNLRYLDLGETLFVLNGTLEHLLSLQCLRYESMIHVDDVDVFNDCVRFIERSDNRLFYRLTMYRPYLEDSEDSEYLQFEVQISDDARFGNLEREVDSDDEEQFGDLEREVEITDWDHAIVSAGRECTGKFILIPQDVQKMTMTNCSGMTNLSGMGLLKNLESLFIFRCGNLRVLCGGQDEEVNNIHDSPAPTPTPTPALAPLPFPNLRDLNIYECPKLKYPLGHGFKSNLPHP